MNSKNGKVIQVDFGAFRQIESPASRGMTRLINALQRQHPDHELPPDTARAAAAAKCAKARRRRIEETGGWGRRGGEKPGRCED